MGHCSHQRKNNNDSKEVAKSYKTFTIPASGPISDSENRSGRSHVNPCPHFQPLNKITIHKHSTTKYASTQCLHRLEQPENNNHSKTGCLIYFLTSLSLNIFLLTATKIPNF